MVAMRRGSICAGAPAHFLDSAGYGSDFEGSKEVKMRRRSRVHRRWWRGEEVLKFATVDVYAHPLS